VRPQSSRAALYGVLRSHVHARKSNTHIASAPDISPHVCDGACNRIGAEMLCNSKMTFAEGVSGTGRPAIQMASWRLKAMWKPQRRTPEKHRMFHHGLRSQVQHPASYRTYGVYPALSTWTSRHVILFFRSSAALLRIMRMSFSYVVQALDSFQ
jgi:hypothetical protein